MNLHYLAIMNEFAPLFESLVDECVVKYRDLDVVTLASPYFVNLFHISRHLVTCETCRRLTSGSPNFYILFHCTIISQNILFTREHQITGKPNILAARALCVFICETAIHAGGRIAGELVEVFCTEGKRDDTTPPQCISYVSEEYMQRFCNIRIHCSKFDPIVMALSKFGKMYRYWSEDQNKVLIYAFGQRIVIYLYNRFYSLPFTPTKTLGRSASCYYTSSFPLCASIYDKRGYPHDMSGSGWDMSFCQVKHKVRECDGCGSTVAVCARYRANRGYDVCSKCMWYVHLLFLHRIKAFSADEIGNHCVILAPLSKLPGNKTTPRLDIMYSVTPMAFGEVVFINEVQMYRKYVLYIGPKLDLLLGDDRFRSAAFDLLYFRMRGWVTHVAFDEGVVNTVNVEVHIPPMLKRLLKPLSNRSHILREYRDAGVHLKIAGDRESR